MRNISKDILSACMFDSENLATCIERGVEGGWFETDGRLYTDLVKTFDGAKWNKRTCLNILDGAGVFRRHTKAADISSDVPQFAFNAEEMGDALEVLAAEHAKRRIETSIANAKARLLSGDDPFDVAASLIDCSEDVESLVDASKERTTKDIARDALEVDTNIAEGVRIGLPFPWIDFQAKTFGIPRRALTPIAGRDGKGKSRLMTYLTHYWVKQGIPILYFPFEDGAERFVSNLASNHGEYDMFTIKRNRVPMDFMGIHESCLGVVADYPIFIEDYPMTAEQMFSCIARYDRKARGMGYANGIEGVVVDGLKDMIFSKGDGTNSQMDHVVSVLNRACKKFDVALMPVSHVNKVDEGNWLSKDNITGTGTQTKSARMVLVYQDAGIPETLKAKYEFNERGIVLQCSKSSYGGKAVVMLDPELEKGRFVEIPKLDRQA